MVKKNRDWESFPKRDQVAGEVKLAILGSERRNADETQWTEWR